MWGSNNSGTLGNADNSFTDTAPRSTLTWVDGTWQGSIYESYRTDGHLNHVFVAASHQTRLDTRSKARRPIKVGIKGRGRSGRSRDSNPACLCCSSAHLVQCEPDEASSFTNPNVGPGTYAWTFKPCTNTELNCEK